MIQGQCTSDVAMDINYPFPPLQIGPKQRFCLLLSKKSIFVIDVIFMLKVIILEMYYYKFNICTKKKKTLTIKKHRLHYRTLSL